MPTANPQSKASFAIATPTFLSPLLADGHDVTSRKGTVASGIGVLLRGTICKIVPATGVITVGATAAEANCVLVDDIDATSATVEAGVYLTGRMKADAVIWPGALNHADVSDALRNVGIYIESVVDGTGSLVKSVPTVEEQKEAIKNLEKARKSAKEKVAEAEEEEEKQPPSDSPLAYLTPDEREANGTDLAVSALHIAHEEFEESQGRELEKKDTGKNAPPKPPEPHNKK